MKSFDIGELTIPIPVIQGGMGVGISLSGLASAVANMGGIGVISSVGLGLIYKNNNGKTNYKKSTKFTERCGAKRNSKELKRCEFQYSRENRYSSNS